MCVEHNTLTLKSTQFMRAVHIDVKGEKKIRTKQIEKFSNLIKREMNFLQFLRCFIILFLLLRVAWFIFYFSFLLKNMRKY